jgi:hypothetical protein
MNKRILIAAVVAIVAAGGVYLMSSSDPATQTTSAETDTNSDIVARNGLHWHPNIEVYVQGVRQQVPANIGIGKGGMGSMHTHETNGKVHLEAAGVVSRDDLQLKKFFEAWGKNFDDFGSKMIMKVNGVEINEGEKYEMQDGDKIILSFFP